MNGVHGTQVISPKQIATDLRMQAYRDGWLDARAGRPPNPAWADHPKEAIAGSYENGRLAAVNVRAAGLPLAFWRFGTAAPSVVSAVKRATQLVGEPKPRGARR